MANGWMHLLYHTWFTHVSPLGFCSATDQKHLTQVESFKRGGKSEQ